ncbi:MAG: indolepyruvate oxidoreductase subunit beta [Anaerolineae bacterium]|nr:indolepyruvate oxidoreductase subunit beta [Anaerolineae bacterium]
MDLKLVLSGIGGQGVLFATSIFSETALALGLNVLGSETHGMSQRGGSVISHLKIGAYESPLVRQGTADVLLAFDEDEAYRTLGFLKRGGLCFVNSARGDSWAEAVKGYLSSSGIAAHSFPADEVALSLGSARSANLVLIGRALSVPGLPFQPDQIGETIQRISPPRFSELNKRAFEAGLRREQ